ncbi:MAG: hypothetical protein KI785_01835 [Devosiaceae bacterium]|nr:hypothetical protein [Devosiaceae bacterium MH13]
MTTLAPPLPRRDGRRQPVWMAAALSFAWLLVLCVLVSPGTALAQGQIAEAIAERGDNFGRLRLEFRDRLDLPVHDLEVENGVLRITFEDAIDTDIRDAVRVLSDYVTIARRDPDGRALRFGLARSVRINRMEAGETLFIDFLPSNWRGFPPPLPDEVVARLAERAEEAARQAAIEERQRLLGELQPEVSLRVGSAPTFTRYAFNWSVPFNVETTQSGAELTVRFDYDVPLDLSPALIDQAAELEDIGVERDGLSLAVTLTTVPGTRIRWFEDGLDFVVDLDRQEPAGESRPGAGAIAAAIDALAPPTPVGQTPFEATVERDDAVSEPESADGAVVSETVPNASAALVPGAAAPEPRPEPVMLDENGEPIADPSADMLAPRPPEVGDMMDADELVEGLHVEVRTDGQMTRLVFPFSRPTAAAAFRRAGTVTLAFETDEMIDTAALSSEVGDKIEAVTPTRRDGVQLLHLRLRGNAMVTAEPSGDRWIISLGPTADRPPEPLQLGRGTLPDGRAYAEFAHEGLGNAIELVHPHVRDTLIVVPMLPPSRGVLSGQALVEFDVLSSATGIVIRPNIDGLETQEEEGRFLVTRETGLSLSEVGLSLGSFGFSPTERTGYFDLRRYLREGPGTFEQRFAAFQTEIALAEDNARAEWLLEFARFLVAFELGQEAVGALDIALDIDPSLEHDPSFLLLNSAALVMAGRYDAASDILNSHAVADLNDGHFWRLLAEAGLRRWPEVNTSYDEALQLFDDYPASLVARARLAGVEAALDTRAFDLARDRLNEIDPLRVPDILRQNVDLLDSRLALAKGRVEEAITGLSDVAKQDHGPIGAQATFRLIQARFDAQELEPEAAMEELENLAVAWRGDDTEVETRAFLSELYTGQGRYADALFALKGVVVSQPDHPEANSIADRMQEIFVELFLFGGADEMSPLDALALFYDFRELTPIGRQGDALVRNLASRMVELDLLDQAADLLQHQVDERLTGTAKAQVAADLALVYLMDYRPGEAVAVLQRSRLSQVPMSIERVRRIIEARALSELGRHDLALEVLRSLAGDDASAVRADVLWNAERWQEAGEEIERMLSQRWADRVPLDDGEMQAVLRAAIAFSFAGDEYALERLRARFDVKMSDGIFASAFDVVTEPIEEQGAAFRDVARSIAGLNTLSRFLDDYRSTFSRQALSRAMPGA